MKLWKLAFFESTTLQRQLQQFVSNIFGRTLICFRFTSKTNEEHITTSKPSTQRCNILEATRKIKTVSELTTN